MIAATDEPIPHLAIDDKRGDEMRVRIVVVNQVFQGLEDLAPLFYAVECLSAPEFALWMGLQGYGRDDRKVVGATAETLPEICVLVFVRIDDVTCR